MMLLLIFNGVLRDTVANRLDHNLRHAPSLACLLLAHLTLAAGAALVGGCRERDGQEAPAVLAARRQRGLGLQC